MSVLDECPICSGIIPSHDEGCPALMDGVVAGSTDEWTEGDDCAVVVRIDDHGGLHIDARNGVNRFAVGAILRDFGNMLLGGSPNATIDGDLDTRQTPYPAGPEELAEELAAALAEVVPMGAEMAAELSNAKRGKAKRRG